MSGTLEVSGRRGFAVQQSIAAPAPGALFPKPPDIFTREGEADEYAADLERALLEVEQRLLSLDPNRVLSELNIIQAYFAKGPLLGIAKARARIIETTLLGSGLPVNYVPPTRNRRKISVGVITNAIHFHTETFATVPFWENLDRERFDVRLYVMQRTGAAIERWCEAQAGHLTVLTPALPEMVREIRNDDLDCLHFGINVAAVSHPIAILAAFKLARIQTTSICSPISTGFSNMDFFLLGLGGRTLEQVQAGYSEQVIALDEPGICLRFPERPTADPTQWHRPIVFPPGKIAYVSGANAYKLGPETRRAWVKILARAPDGVLGIYCQGPSWSNRYPIEAIKAAFQRECMSQAVDPERIIWIPPMASAGEIPGLLKQAHVYLDSLNYSGNLSVNDAIEAGLPVVTMSGDQQRFNQGAALLGSFGQTSFPTNEAEYVQDAVDFVRAPTMWRRRVSTENAAYDSKRYGKQIERFLINAIPH